MYRASLQNFLRCFTATAAGSADEPNAVPNGANVGAAAAAAAGAPAAGPAKDTDGELRPRVRNAFSDTGKFIAGVALDDEEEDAEAAAIDPLTGGVFGVLRPLNPPRVLLNS